MMKKLLSSVFVLTILLSGTVNAETSSTSTNRIKEMKQKITDIKQKTLEDKVKIKEQIASTTADIKNVRQELKSMAEIRIGKKLEDKKIKVADVFEKSIQNLKDLVVRIESRMSKMESNNIDVSSPKLLLDTAKTKITLAETELINLENLLTEDLPTVSTSTSKNNVKKTLLSKIRLQSEKAKSAIKNAHKSIVEVVTSLKPGLLEEKKTASSSQTASTTNN